MTAGNNRSDKLFGIAREFRSVSDTSGRRHLAGCNGGKVPSPASGRTGWDKMPATGVAEGAATRQRWHNDATQPH